VALQTTLLLSANDEAQASSTSRVLTRFFDVQSAGLLHWSSGMRLIVKLVVQVAAVALVV
jgi:hypothetical protein